MSINHSPEATILKIHRKSRWNFSTEEKLRIVLEGLTGDMDINKLCNREGINKNLYYLWRKEFLGSGEIQQKQDLEERLKANKELNAIIREKDHLKEIIERFVSK